MFNKYVRLAPTFMVAFLDEDTTLQPVNDKQGAFKVTHKGNQLDCYAVTSAIKSDTDPSTLAVVIEGNNHLLVMKAVIENDYAPVVEPTDEPEAPPTTETVDHQPA
jgi:hypothetical protein